MPFEKIWREIDMRGALQILLFLNYFVIENSPRVVLEVWALKDALVPPWERRMCKSTTTLYVLCIRLVEETEATSN